MADRSLNLTRRGALRSALGLSILLAVGTSAGVAFAGSYLHRASVLLRGAELEAAALRARFHDKELAHLPHRLALGRAETAREMIVPEEVTRAHPPLLLVLEAYERAADAAVRRQQTDFLVALAKAREETSVLVALLKQEGWELPK
jgi:hypothetical protein